MINFENAKLIAYNHSNIFTNDAFHIASRKHLIIEGSIYNLTNQQGVSGVWQGIVGMVASATDYDSIIINGINWGSGRINSINFTEGNDVRTKSYSVDITIFSEGNLFNMIGPDYTGITLPNIHLTEKFSESFDFTISENGIYSYKQTVNVAYIKGGSISDPVAAAKTLASELLNSSPAYGFIDSQHAGFYTTPGRRVYNETYNKITNECSFTESFTQGEVFSGYSATYTVEIQTGEDGISVVTENGKVEGTTGPDYMASAQTGLTTQLSDSYARAGIILSTYLSGAASLNSTPIISHRRVNLFTNSIEYSIQYNNDARNHLTYSWEYTQEAVRPPGSCYYTVKESGVIRGITSDCTRAQQYSNALAGWSTIKSGILTRLNSYYNTISGLSNTLQLVSAVQGKSLPKGEINYSYSYTDDLTYKSDVSIKRIETDIEDTVPIEFLNIFVGGSVGEIVQDLGLAKEGKRTVKIKITGHRGTNFDTYLSKAKDTANALVPDGRDVFINACQYSFSPLSNGFSLSVTWTYFGDAFGIFV